MAAALHSLGTRLARPAGSPAALGLGRLRHRPAALRAMAGTATDLDKSTPDSKWREILSTEEVCPVFVRVLWTWVRRLWAGVRGGRRQAL